MDIHGNEIAYHYADFAVGYAIERHRLASVHSEAGGSVVRRYTLSYATTSHSNRSRLVAVQECAGDGYTCYNPTAFEWTDAVIGWSVGGAGVPDDLLDAEGRRRGVLADLDTDGRVDWVTAYIDESDDSSGATTAELVDLNGDGLPDVVETWRDAAGNVHHGAWLNTGSGFVVAPTWQLPDVLVDLPPGYHRPDIADVFQQLTGV